MDNEKRRVVRAALVSGDGALIVATLANADLDRCAQQVGDALIAAVEHDAFEVHQLAMRCAVVLRQRSWEGDDELATELIVALDRNSATTLTALRVDLDDVADLLDSGNGEGGWIDLVTGDSWTRDMLDNYDELDEHRPSFDDDPDRWLTVPSLGGRAAYRDMEHFISGIVDAEMADRLAIAIDGPGAFRRFKNVLRSAPDLEDNWYEYSNERRRGRARAWLAHAGYRPEQRVYRPDIS